MLRCWFTLAVIYLSLYASATLVGQRSARRPDAPHDNRQFSFEQ